ncbi:MAG: DUF362 domain-containing protein [Deltaproteobacteria bacterium]|nr:DUF362 domain-containing protein [Deltaproteobacteria bacterium]
MVMSTVVIERCENMPLFGGGHLGESIKILTEALSRVFDLLGGLNKYVKNGDRVLIKPNVVVPEPPWTGVNTDPRVLEALIELIKGNNPKRIMVGEHVRWHGPRVFEVSGVGEAVRRAGGEIIIFDDMDHVPVNNPLGTLESVLNVPEVYLECDVFMNVPRMKTHLDTLISLCLKNMMGMVPSDPDCLAMHQHLCDSIVDLNRFFQPKLNIVDGIIAHEGQGPMFGTPVPDMNVLVAGDDCVAVDAVASAVMGIDPREAPTTRLAVCQGLGTADLSRIKIKGRRINEVRRHFLRPMQNAVGYMRYDGVSYPVDFYVGTACQGCHGAIREQVDQLALLAEVEGVPEENRRRLVVITGRDARVPYELRQDDFVWVVGDCAVQHQDRGIFAPGCPPAPTRELGPGCIGVPLSWPVLGRNDRLKPKCIEGGEAQE